MLHQICVVKDDFVILKSLIVANVDINAINYDDVIALKYAIRQNHFKNTIYLLKSNVNFEIVNVDNHTSILMTVFYQTNQILKTFLNHNVNYKKLSFYRQTILHVIACEKISKIINVLTNARLQNVDVFAKNSENKICLKCFNTRKNSDSALRSAFERMFNSVTRENNFVQQIDMIAIDNNFEKNQFANAVE